MSTTNTVSARGTARRRKLIRVWISATVAALAVSAASVGVAQAATSPPSATTTSATNLTSTTATLNGTVTADKSATAYHFQYGTTTAYGSTTATQTQAAANGHNAHQVSANVAGLSPSTTYHFRVVATNSVGTVNGSDMIFTTPAAGGTGTGTNSVTISARPSAVTYGHSATISGRLSGPKNAGAKVTLEASPYPYTAPFKPTGATGTTTATGTYSFVVTPPTNTHYRVSIKKPSLISSVSAVRVRVNVSLRVSTLNPRSGQLVRFSGSVIPAHNGKVALIQRRTSTGGWRTVGRATLVPGVTVLGVPTSKFSKRLRVSHTGTYRVSVNPRDGDHITGTSGTRRLRTH